MLVPEMGKPFHVGIPPLNVDLHCRIDDKTVLYNFSIALRIEFAAA